MADADFGALIVTESGNALVTPQYYPLTLYQKVSVTSTSGGGAQTATVTITLPNSWGMVLPFAGSSKPAQGFVALAVTRRGNAITFTGYNMFDSVYTMHCFVFTQFEQSIPASGYGLAIWDAAGRLILTNESRVLTDMTTIGTQGSAGAGINIDTSIVGRYAVSPELSGVVYYRVDAGGHIVPIPAAFEASFDGINTHLRSAPTVNTGGAQQVGGESFGNTMKIINMDNYL